MPKFYLSSPVLLFFLLLSATGARGQDIAPVPSPTAANLGLYGEIPVSYYTGTPNISIPLYEIKGRQVNVPITLTYHPSGIRPEIHPGPTGLGWSLQAGGVITRTVKGKGADEWDGAGKTVIVHGYLKHTVVDKWEKHIEINSAMVDSDYEPDEFSFNFLGITGKFYFDHNGAIQVQCDRPVKVIFDNEFITPYDLLFNYQLPYGYEGNFNRSIKGFTIIDELGTRYSFGGDNAVEFSDPISYGQNSNGGSPCGLPAKGNLFQATSWFLTKITSADSVDVITFDYERGPFIAQLFRYLDVYENTNALGNSKGPMYLIWGGTIICPVYLTKISKTNGEVLTFTLGKSNELSYNENDYERILCDPVSHSMYTYSLLDQVDAIPRLRENRSSNIFDHIQWLKLDGIAVENSLGEQLRTVKFTYNDTPEERLFLEGLAIESASSEKELTYSFGYKDRDILRQFPYLACITDHWGFLNGKRYSYNGGFDTRERDSDVAHVAGGVLESIQYPTGGTVRFTYEMHDYAKSVDRKNRTVMIAGNGVAGGLRIKKIVTNTMNGDSTIRDFFYSSTPSASTSSGVLNVLPNYVYDISGYDLGNAWLEITHICSYPIIPLTKENDGRYIGYTAVCEQVLDGSGGYTRYTYTNHDNGYHDMPPFYSWNRDIFPFGPHNSRYFERGRLLTEQRYNHRQDLVWERKNVWDRYGSQGEDNPRALYSEGFRVGYGHISSVAYLNYCYKFLPSRTEEILYSAQSDPLVTAKDYTYNSDYLLQTETTVNSAGHRVTTRFRYPKDILNQRTVEQPTGGW